VKLNRQKRKKRGGNNMLKVKYNVIYNEYNEIIGSTNGNSALIDLKLASNADIQKLENEGYVLKYII
jgi:hypothetical protein